MPPTEHREMLSAMARYIPIAHTLAAFRRRVWEEAGGYPEVPNLVDLRFWLRVGKLGWRFATVPEVLGEHNVHASSFFHQSFKYVERQRDLARVQAQIVRELKLPSWMYVYLGGSARVRLSAPRVEARPAPTRRRVPGTRCMRIFLLSTSMGMGGADQQILILARAMRARGHEIRIVALTPLGPMGLEAQREGIPTESLELRRNPGDMPRIVGLIRMLREWRPDILHSHMVHANLLARAVRPFIHVRGLVSTIHSISDGGRVRMAGYRLTNRLVDRVTIISRLAAERYVAIGAVPVSRLEVIPNTVDLERFRPMPASAPPYVRRSASVTSSCGWRSAASSRRKTIPP